MTPEQVICVMVISIFAMAAIYFDIQKYFRRIHVRKEKG